MAIACFEQGAPSSLELHSLGWMVERIVDVETPVDTLVNTFARHALWAGGGLFIVSSASD